MTKRALLFKSRGVNDEVKKENGSKNASLFLSNILANTGEMISTLLETLTEVVLKIWRV